VLDQRRQHREILRTTGRLLGADHVPQCGHRHVHIEEPDNDPRSDQVVVAVGPLRLVGDVERAVRSDEIEEARDPAKALAVRA
jgi:hypothetical protein